MSDIIIIFSFVLQCSRGISEVFCLFSNAHRVIGEEKTLSIKIGQEAGGETADFILVRGTSADVDRAIKEIHTIVENAKNDIIDNSHVSLFFKLCTFF